jgi:hypothetical protein
LSNGIEDSIGADLSRGCDLMHAPDAPEDGWYVLWVDQNGDEHRHPAWLEGSGGNASKYIASDRPVPMAHIVGLYHDDYFPPPQD